MLRTQFEMELLVYTQDSTYSKKLGKRKREEAEQEKSIGRPHSSNENGATLKEMMKHFKSYYQVNVILHVALFINHTHFH